MPLPMSKSQINKLGKRLAAAGEDISAQDNEMLEDLIACHQEVLEQTRPRLDGLEAAVGTGPLSISFRPKTTKTIIEKLQRSPRGPLASIQDLAGFRIVGGISFEQQDQLRDELMSRFPADPAEPSYKDRRAAPSSGYRAVHVLACADGVNIEIQIRTLAQHMWADLMERLADRLGRQIRYGGAPTAPAGLSQRNAERMVSTMISLSDEWASTPPDLPGSLALAVDEFTDDVWNKLTSSLGEAGIDL
jgi:Region found in RelA / SpoT proteins